jgi:mannose-6-phosphate isomerase-like protein (cupin superfamily)
MNGNGTSQAATDDPGGALSGKDKMAVEKIWGTARALYRDDQTELFRITARRGGYSSRHQHRHKANGFLVVRGRLLLVCYRGGTQTRQVLTPDDGLHVVEAGIDHRFIALEEPTTAYEFYYATTGRTADPRDIVRRDQGGVIQGSVDQIPW